VTFSRLILSCRYHLADLKKIDDLEKDYHIDADLNDDESLHAGEHEEDSTHSDGSKSKTVSQEAPAKSMRTHVECNVAGLHEPDDSSLHNVVEHDSAEHISEHQIDNDHRDDRSHGKVMERKDGLAVEHGSSHPDDLAGHDDHLTHIEDPQNPSEQHRKGVHEGEHSVHVADDSEPERHEDFHHGVMEDHIVENSTQTEGASGHHEVADHDEKASRTEHMEGHGKGVGDDERHRSCFLLIHFQVTLQTPTVVMNRQITMARRRDLRM
jgi:hypothetical protein